MGPTKLVLDVDTGTDDAVAIMLAALHPGLELVGVSTVNGNVPVDRVTENTLRVLDHIGRADIPVYEGSAAPLVRRDLPVSPGFDSDIHGEYLDLPAAVSHKRDGAAAAWLVERFAAAAAEGEGLVLVATGPLTNIALAMKLDPGFAGNVARMVIMGGGHEISNVTSAAEFNIWVDPEAADVVFAGGVEDVTLVPLDATHQALVSRADCAALRALGTPAGEATASAIERRIDAYGRTQPMERPGTAPVHDAVCVAHLVEPKVLKDVGRYHVAVEMSGAKTIGRTIIDTHHRGAEPNMDVAFGADERLFVDLLLETFAARP